MVTFLRVRIPIVGRVGVTDRCSFPIIRRGDRTRVGRIPRPQLQGEAWRAGGDGTDWPQTMADRPSSSMAHRLLQ
jgi:hypothetical protein